jgi:hypothetical protein
MTAWIILAIAILVILLAAGFLRARRAELHDQLQGLCEFHVSGDRG